MYENTKHVFAKHGILVDNPRMDIQKMLAQKNASVSKLTGGIEYLFKKNGVCFFLFSSFCFFALYLIFLRFPMKKDLVKLQRLIL